MRCSADGLFNVLSPSMHKAQGCAVNRQATLPPHPSLDGDWLQLSDKLAHSHLGIIDQY